MTPVRKNSIGNLGDRLGSASKKAYDAVKRLPSEGAPGGLVVGGAAGAAVGGALGGALAAAEGVALNAIGFTALGPAAGSYAATWMSSIALSNGVGVSAGSIYSTAQAAAMGGTALLGGPFVVGVLVIGAAVGVATSAVSIMAKRKRGGGGGCDASGAGDASEEGDAPEEGDAGDAPGSPDDPATPKLSSEDLFMEQLEQSILDHPDDKLLFR